MKNIEKTLINYLLGKGPNISKEELSFHAENDANETINIFFKIINIAIEQINGVGTADRILNLLDNVSNIMSIESNINRKAIIRKLSKISEKADRVMVENKKNFVNENIAKRELKRIQEKIDKLLNQAEEKDTKQYDLMRYLIDELRNIACIEIALTKMNGLANATDKYDNSLLSNLIRRYVENVIDDEEEDTLYFNNLITLVTSQKSFKMQEKERRKILEYINTTIDKLSADKRKAKKNSEKIVQLQNIINIVKGLDEPTPKKIDIIADKYHINVHFDENIIEKAKLVKIPKEGTMTDREEIDDYIITIDGENAQEIDDALSCRKLPNGNYLLGVHIASILGYFPYESEIVQEAISRNRSIYLSKIYQKKDDDFCRTIPIFPYEFSAKTASLIPGEKKLARTYYFEIDKDGNIVNERFIKSIIKSSKKTTYTEVNKIIENGCDDKKLEELVNNLKEVASILDKRYIPTELYEQVKEYTDDCSDLRVKRVGAEKIVYQSMMLTGNRVAEFFAKSDEKYPCLYRVHKINEENARKLSTMVKNLTKSYGGELFSKFYQMIEALYPKGWYDTEGSHYGLGLEHYCHCTSGLRRAADIIVEHALEVCYDKNPTKEELEELKNEIAKKAIEINSSENTIEWFIKDYNRAYQKRR